MPASNDVAFVRCPRCGKSTTSGRKEFQREDLDIECKWHFCKKTFPIMRWHCRCGVPWHTCGVHKYNYTNTEKVNACASQNADVEHKRLPCKRRPSDSHEEILRQDVKKHGAQNIAKQPRLTEVVLVQDDAIPPSKRPRVLGPIPQARFGGALASFF